VAPCLCSISRSLSRARPTGSRKVRDLGPARPWAVGAAGAASSPLPPLAWRASWWRGRRVRCGAAWCGLSSSRLVRRRKGERGIVLVGSARQWNRGVGPLVGRMASAGELGRRSEIRPTRRVGWLGRLAGPRPKAVSGLVGWSTGLLGRRVGPFFYFMDPSPINLICI